MSELLVDFMHSIYNFPSFDFFSDVKMSLTKLLDSYGGCLETQENTIVRIDSFNEALNHYIEENFK